MLVFSTRLCELLLLSPSLWFTSPSSPLPCVNKYTVTRIQCVRGCGGGPGPRTDKHLPQSLFTGQFLEDDILHCLLRVLSFFGRDKSVRMICPRAENPGNSGSPNVQEYYVQGHTLSCHRLKEASMRIGRGSFQLFLALMSWSVLFSFTYSLTVIKNMELL